MVIISAIFSVTDVVVKASDLVSRLPGKWYRGGTEIEKFKSSLFYLSRSTVQWENQLKQHEMSEDPVYNAFLVQAIELLDAEKDFFENHRKNWSWKFKRRPFPRQLTYILSNIVEIVQAGPERLARRLERHELLTKRFLMVPSPLPFGYNAKYVPLVETVHEVQRALEDTEGQQVVTLYGEPGMGKSSLAKYVALQYQDSIQGSSSCSFDGVQFLYCGQNCRENLRQLRRELFSNLGLRAIFGADGGEDHSSSTYQSALRQVLRGRRMLIILDDVWEEDFEVLTNLICLGTRCRYLLTSQTKNVWLDASPIQLPSPTTDQAFNILASYLQGGSGGDQAQSVGANMETGIFSVIGNLGNHPLSLVNVAISRNRDGAIASQWKSIAQNVFAFLDDNDHTRHILVYERPYSLTLSVRATMMLMVDSLREAERNVLFLIALLQRGIWRDGAAEHLVKFFARRFSRGNFSTSAYKYLSSLKYLEDQSLVRVIRAGRSATTSVDYNVDTNLPWLSIHRLRREYIMRKRFPALRSIASSLVATSRDDDLDGARALGSIRDRDNVLAVVLGAVCFDEALIDEVALPFQRIIAQTNGDGALRGLHQGADSRAMSWMAIPRDPEQMVGARKLVENVRGLIHVHYMSAIAELLNLEGEEMWKQQARSDAAKVLMKLACKQQLEDACMASLLTIPYIWDRTCRTFDLIYQGMYRGNLRHAFYYGEQKSLSDTMPATWKALSNLLHNKNLRAAKYIGELHSWGHISINSQGAMSNIIKYMFEFELESTILSELHKLNDLADGSPHPDPAFRIAVYDAVLQLHRRSRLTFEMMEGLNLQHYVPTILWELINGQHPEVTSGSSGSSRDEMCYIATECAMEDSPYVKAVLTFSACAHWLTDAALCRQLLGLENSLYRGWSPLESLSNTPEFRAVTPGYLRGKSWEEEDFTPWPENRNERHARFWGNVALLRDLPGNVSLRLVKMAKEGIAKLSQYNNGQLFCPSCKCSCVELDECCTCFERKKYILIHRVSPVTRMVTITNHLHGSTSLVESALEGSPEKWKRATTCIDCMLMRWMFYVQACHAQGEAYHQMKKFAEALLYLDLGLQACQAFLADSSRRKILDLYAEDKNLPKNVQTDLRSHIMLIKTLSEDYEGAMSSLHQLEQDLLSFGKRNNYGWQFYICTNRAVLFSLSGEFWKAIDDFNKSLEEWEAMTMHRRYFGDDPRVHNFVKCCLLEHCGYTKYLMGDLEGSKSDREVAASLRASKRLVEPVSWERVSWWDKYDIGRSGHWLLQLPKDKNW